MMNNKRLLRKLIFGTVIFITGTVLIIACGDGNPRTTTPDNNDGLEVVPGTQRPNNPNQEEQTFETSLDGSNEVPKVETDAEGSVTVTLVGDSIQVKGEFSGLSASFAGSHIHKGAEGKNGNPILTLKPDVGSDKTSGTWDDSYTLDEENLIALRRNSLYINVHSADHKSGEIRGQLTSGLLQ